MTIKYLVIGAIVATLLGSSQIAVASTDNPSIQREFGSHCPEGYHSTIDDETGQCYPNSEGCRYDHLVLNKDKDICIYENMCERFPNARECLNKESHCNLYPDADYCKSDANECQDHLKGNRCGDNDDT